MKSNLKENNSEKILESTIKDYIPLDKSWIIRMGVLDMIHGRNEINKFLAKQKNIGEDLLALKRASQDWNKKNVNVGESGTLYRFLQFASWKLNLDKKFIKKGTLRSRKITSNPKIVSYPLEKLLKLDNSTSQWASASVLMGNFTKPKKIPFKLATTYEAVRHWKDNKPWVPKYDQTIQKQAETFLKLLRGQKPKFKPAQAEDFCFAYIFGYISKKSAENKWPALKGHESNRFIEMDDMIKKMGSGKTIDSKDHRVIQTLVMWAAVHHQKIKIKYPKAVNKSWPQFWQFMEYASLKK